MRRLKIPKSSCKIILAGIILIISPGLDAQEKATISGDLKTWHKVTLTFEGPGYSEGEQAQPNPFLNARLMVYFTNGKKLYTVPGYFAADGNAGETGADSGNKWRVHFSPDKTGTWTYMVSFRVGPNIAVSTEPGEGKPGDLDGITGSFAIGDSDKNGRDFRGKGTIQYAGDRYLRFSGTGEAFLHAGAMSPENFLGYYEFDNTYDVVTNRKVGGQLVDGYIHEFKPHAGDWKTGDPTWKGGKGKNIIGALNYFASKGMNSVLFLPYTLDGGDGSDTWMWTKPDERLRFDCSKLDQWEIVFTHMTKLGLVWHVLTSEAENVRGLDGGELGIERKLYYREMIARFGHHPGIIWNLGEENNNTDAQRRAYSAYLKSTDPYGHAVVTHSYPAERHQVYTALLGYPLFDGASLQMDETGSGSHAETIKWLTLSEMMGQQWIVQVDEYGHGTHGVMTDSLNPGHDEPRINVLWGNLMAGGSGVSWYFGYRYPHNDLLCEDWRTRDIMWDQTRHAITFFHEFLPFDNMKSKDDLVSNGWCFAIPGQVYCVYLPQGGTTELKLEEGDYSVQWYNPRKGGDLLQGTVARIAGPGVAALGEPPGDTDKDWIIYCKKK